MAGSRLRSPNDDSTDGESTTMMPSKRPPTTSRPVPVKIRALMPGDLAAMVEIDRAVLGRSRRGFYEKRLAHLKREPAGFVALAAERDGRLAGFALARRYEGEFGGELPEAALDAVGVAAEARHEGVGRGLVEAVAAALRAHRTRELSTEVDWTDAALSSFFARTGFLPAPRLVLERGVAPVTRPRPASMAAGEVDDGASAGDDFEALSHDRMPIRSMAAEDLAANLRIDRHHTGRDRAAYFARKHAELLRDPGLRVSLAAEVDGRVAGFVMAEVELGEVGSVEPEAVIDTIGVDPDCGRRSVGTALLSQLMTNLAGLRVERVRTEVGWTDFGLLRFLDRLGFRPGSRLALRRAVE